MAIQRTYTDKNHQKRSPLKVIQLPSKRNVQDRELRELKLTFLPPEGDKSGSKRRVRFQRSVRVRVVDRRQLDEKKDSWYTTKDYQKFELDRRSTVQTAQDSLGDVAKLGEEEGFTTVGLEGHLYRHLAYARRRLTKQHCYSVLQQQYYNRYYGLSDPESIRRISEAYSKQPLLNHGHIHGAIQHTLISML